MPRTIDEAFFIFLQRLTPSTLEARGAVSHRASVVACLRAEFGSVRLFRSGSFGHHTSVRGWSDTDYFAVLPKGRLGPNSARTLAKVRDVLASRFPRTKVSIRTPAVVLPFGSTAAERLEVIPAGQHGRLMDYELFIIADSNGGWKQASPLAHNSYVNEQNVRLSTKVKPIVRFLKKWSFEKRAGVRSVYLELRVAEFAKGRKSILYSRDMLAVLKYLHDRNLAPMRDPVGLAGYIRPCTDAVKPTALCRLATAVTRAQKAVDLERVGLTEEAFHYWDLLFGKGFPSYR